MGDPKPDLEDDKGGDIAVIEPGEILIADQGEVQGDSGGNHNEGAPTSDDQRPWSCR